MLKAIKVLEKALEVAKQENAIEVVAGIGYAINLLNDEEKRNAPDALFDTFWKAYPNKKAKPMALKAWKKLKVDAVLAERIMLALELHKKTPQWSKDDGQYIPHPSTWLNQQRWEDELKSEKSSENQSKFGHLS